MPIRVSRPMDYANRFGIQQADQAIKRDVVRALVELITNSDDSYRRLQMRGQSSDGRILIEFHRRRANAFIRVIDFAEGMNGETLDRALGIYAEDTSGLTSGAPVRGYFGRGVKDAILGLGSGIVTGIVQRQLHSAWLGIRNGRPHYEAQVATPVPEAFLRNLGGATGSNATVVEITVSRQDVRIPQFENLRRQLTLYFSLRDISTNPGRTVLLREVDPSGLIRREFQLSYQFPSGRELAHQTLPLSDPGITCEAILWRSDEPLDTPRENGPLAQAGLLIKGHNAVFDNTLFKFDGNIHAQRFFGSVMCTHIDVLLQTNQPIVLATRDGLDHAHSFIADLLRTCEQFLGPFVEEEARRARAEEYRVRNEQLRRKFSSALAQLNNLAQEELTQLDPEGGPAPATPLVPESGFGFVPEYAHVLTARQKTLLVRSLTPRVIPEGARITISSDHSAVAVLTPHITIESREDYDWVGEAKVMVEGRQVGAEAVLTAECEGLTSEALVRVVAREDRGNGDGQTRRSGLFNEIRFTDEQNPRQRVRYDRETHDIIIAVRHSSVLPYIKDASGTGGDTPQGQVMLAELVSEAVCAAVARRGVETGRFAAPVGGEIEAIQVQQLRLQNLWAGLIHETLVDPEYR